MEKLGASSFILFTLLALVSSLYGSKLGLLISRYSLHACEASTCILKCPKFSNLRSPLALCPGRIRDLELIRSEKSYYIILERWENPACQTPLAHCGHVFRIIIDHYQIRSQ